MTVVSFVHRVHPPLGSGSRVADEVIGMGRATSSTRRISNETTTANPRRARLIWGRDDVFG